jgi:hypothetical protein
MRYDRDRQRNGRSMESTRSTLLAYIIRFMVSTARGTSIFSAIPSVH